MKIKNEILQEVRKNTKLKRELMYRLGFSEATLYRHLSNNEENGELTKVMSVKIISLGLGISEDMVLTA